MSVLPRPLAIAPLVGRGSELAALVRLLDVVADGATATALVTGPDGIGKSRLADELIAAARQRGFGTGTGRGAAEPEAPDLWAWRGALDGLGIQPAPPAAPPASHFGRFLGVADRLRQLSAAAPLVVVLDDAQDADRESVRLAAFLDREPALRLLQVLVRSADREGAPETARLLDALARRAHVIELGGLPAPAAQALLGAAGDVDPDLLQAALVLTRGNPSRLLSLAAAGRGSPQGLTTALGRATVERLAGTPAGERRLIATAALFGPAVGLHELARMADAVPAEVALAIEHALGFGLMEGDCQRFQVVHPVVASALASTLSSAERLAVHARAAETLSGHDAETVRRRTHHALEAAAASSDAAVRAVAILRESAPVLRGVDGFDAAARLLESASAIQRAAAPAAPAAALAVEHADAVLASGRLGESRLLHEQAARLADREGNAIALAEAALGLAGLWVSEHRLTSEAAAVTAWQQRALDRLPDEASVLRARLRMRLAAEAAYRESAVRPVFAALDAVRATGDSRALAEALSLAHHALLTPEHATRRLVMAQELIATACRAGDDLLALVGVCWRAVDLFQLGHSRATAALDELRQRSEALGCRSLRFIAAAMDVMLAIRGGAFEEAEAGAEACFALGREVGDADALAYRTAHLAAIRYFQGREPELAAVAASVADSPTLIEPRERSFSAAAALFALRAGQSEPGRALLERVRRDGIASMPDSSSWLTTVAAVAELALLLDDAASAKAAYGALLRHGGQPLIASLAIVCFGSAQRPLGLAALACGNLDLAITHLAAAVEANRELHHRPAEIVARAELGLARVRRATGDDDTAGRGLVAEAIDAATALGMMALVDRWRATLPERPAAGDPLIDVAMVQQPSGAWRIAVGAEVATVVDRVGLRYLAELVAAPERSVPALALVLRGEAEPATSRAPVLDARAIAALRDRMAVLRQLEAPTPEDDEELDALTHELARSTGLGGRVRTFADAPERARTAVRKAIKRAIDAVDGANPAIGQHLARRVETGTVCCYHRRPLATGAVD